MSGFSADWLALREPADREARAAAMWQWLADGSGARSPLRFLDLATGTGSNVRYLAPLAGGVQHWVLADHDAALLEAMPGHLAGWASASGYKLKGGTDILVLDGDGFESRLERMCIDLARDFDSLSLANLECVTTAALLDLVSAEWLVRLAHRCSEAGVALLCALNYDGRMDCTPADEADAPIRDLVNRHQKTDKGFGPALGPDCATFAVQAFERAGYEVRSADSDWVIGPDQAALQAELIRGWAAAATEISPGEASLISAWCNRRLAHVDAGTSHLRVGHRDIAARPATLSGIAR